MANRCGLRIQPSSLLLLQPGITPKTRNRIRRMLRINCAEDSTFALGKLPLTACTWLSSHARLLFGTQEVRIITVGTVISTESNTEGTTPWYYLVEIELCRNGDNKSMHSVFERWDPTVKLPMCFEAWMFPDRSRPACVPGELFMSLKRITRQSESLRFDEIRKNDVVRVECTLQRLDVIARNPGPARWDTAPPLHVLDTQDRMPDPILPAMPAPEEMQGLECVAGPSGASAPSGEAHGHKRKRSGEHARRLFVTLTSSGQDNGFLTVSSSLGAATREEHRDQHGRVATGWALRCCGALPTAEVHGILAPNEQGVDTKAGTEEACRGDRLNPPAEGPAERARPGHIRLDSAILQPTRLVFPSWVSDKTRRRAQRFVMQNSVQEATFACQNVPLSACRWSSSSESLLLGTEEVRVVTVGSVVCTEIHEPGEPMFFNLELDLCRQGDVASHYQILTHWGHKAAPPAPIFFKAWSLPAEGTTEPLHGHAYMSLDRIGHDSEGIDLKDIRALHASHHETSVSPLVLYITVSLSMSRAPAPPVDSARHGRHGLSLRLASLPIEDGEPETLNEVINTVPHPLTPRTRERLGFPPLTPGVEIWPPRGWENAWSFAEEGREWGAPIASDWGEPEQPPWQPGEGTLTFVRANIDARPNITQPAFLLAGDGVARTGGWDYRYHNEFQDSRSGSRRLTDIPGLVVCTWKLSDESNEHFRAWLQIFAWVSSPHPAEEADEINAAWGTLLDCIRSEIDAPNGNPVAAVSRVLQRAHDVLPVSRLGREAARAAGKSKDVDVLGAGMIFGMMVLELTSKHGDELHHAVVSTGELPRTDVVPRT
ncbi:hypothetical protein K466DRAFT_568381 [Polyporus arcularius HHB13444]|uniref:Uncharacterized protein n=1 Tax=Polyporus arcularius HHB13444 TaxID=1314778 RepID=A0A5C3NYJ5_9APHY|nr:hypothetical protein K466DRAFT_568381 [Polyporus arcularius HHB13444]